MSTDLFSRDLFSLRGRTALITGGSRGIGKMIAAGFVAQGAKVYISSRKAEACEKAAAELSKGGASAGNRRAGRQYRWVDYEGKLDAKRLKRSAR